MPTTPFPHQERAVNSAWALYESGRRKVCITTCCGGGKTRTAVYIIKEAMQKILAVSSTGQVRVCFMGHRKLLVSQTSRVFTEEEIEHGIRAADFPENFDIPIQISSRDTEISRCLGKKARWSVPQLDLLIIDERHVNKAGKIIELEQRMRDLNPNLWTLSLTATPVDIWNVCEDIVIAGTNSELRETTPPLHLPCKVLAPDMLDIAMLKRNKVSGEFEENSSPWAKAQFAPTIFGRVYPHWRKHNPEQRPTILFAPSVASSMYFVDLFLEQGIPAAHIDGECIYTGDKNEDGSNRVDYSTSIEKREQIFAKLKSGEIKVLCNRLVLADAIDLPWAYCLVLATAFGSIATYLQAVGRIQRAHPSLPGHVCVARGTKILTNKGLVEIQNVTREHRVWDGIEFVEHDGAICRGVKPVIEWDDLVATPDHKVHTEAGWEEISEANKGQRRITVTGVGWKTVRVLDDSDPHDTRGFCIVEGGGGLCHMRSQVKDAFLQTGRKGSSRMLSLHEQILERCSRVDLSSSSKAMEAMQSTRKSVIQRLWRQRHRVSIQVRFRGHSMDCQEHRSSRRQKPNYRSNRQRWTLRTWKLEVGNPCRAGQEQAEAESQAWDRGTVESCVSSREIQSAKNRRTVSERHVFRGDCKEVGSEPDLCEHAKSEVWDIVNCGPRHRYTANGKLVANCVLDHGGNVHRFGHPDIDREWRVGDKWSDFVREIGEEHDRIKDKSKPEEDQKEILCECGQFRMGGPVCPGCGKQGGKGKLLVLQINGRLKPFDQWKKKPKKINTDPPAVKEWKNLVYSSRKSKSEKAMTFETMINVFKNKCPNARVHVNIDKERNKRYSVLCDGIPVPLPLIPLASDSHMMCQRVNAVSQDDFKKLYGLPKQ